MMSRNHLAELSRDWTRLGLEDPLWAVCVDPARRGGRWQLDDFLATGRAEISDAMSRLDQLGICQSRISALDFGCGVGRLTAALSAHFESVTGVDIAPSMIEHAQRMHSATGCVFVVNDQPDLSAFGDGSFDLVYSSLVLQHMPPALADCYLREFVRVVRPGGAIVLVVPETHRRTARGLVYAHVPHPMVRWVQLTLFGYPASMRMEAVPASRIAKILGSGDANIVASDPQLIPGSHWRMLRHYIGVTPPDRPSPGLAASSGVNSTELT
jgi:SAM-dependent methyltransferase